MNFQDFRDKVQKRLKYNERMKRHQQTDECKAKRLERDRVKAGNERYNGEPRNDRGY